MGPVSERVDWMDRLRGAAIILVVLLHSSEALRYYADYLPTCIANFNQFFEPFRMPSLMALSGMLLGRALRKDKRRYFAGKFRTIGWAYLLWTILELFAEGDLTWRVAVQIPFIPPTYLWFLWFLLAYYSLAYFCVKRINSLWIAVFALAASGFLPDDFRLEKFAFLMGFFFLGHWGAGRWDLVQAWIRRPVIQLVALGAGLAVGVLDVLDEKVLYQPLYVWGVLGGLVVAIYWLQRLPEGWLASAFSFAGRNSLVFYVAHMVPLKAAAVIMRSGGITDPRIMYPLLIGVGLGAPLALVWIISRRPAVAALVRFPLRAKVPV